MSKRQDVGKPSLRALSFMLRNEETWPAGFVWNFRNCHRCAMGLAHVVWKDHVHTPSCGDMSDVFSLGPGIAMALFTGGFSEGHEISPEIVADRIDNYLHFCGEF